VFVWFLASYSVLRTLLEFLRNDERGGLLGLSTSQLISLAICLPLPWLAVQLKRRAARVKEGAPVTLIVP
jgi:phosphatidylglycerol:prolipoprotein diacylglycerol transferase